MIPNNYGIQTTRSHINFGFRLMLPENGDSMLCFLHFHERLNFYQIRRPKYCPPSGRMARDVKIIQDFCTSFHSFRDIVSSPTLEQFSFSLIPLQTESHLQVTHLVKDSLSETCTPDRLQKRTLLTPMHEHLCNFLQQWLHSHLNVLPSFSICVSLELSPVSKGEPFPPVSFPGVSLNACIFLNKAAVVSSPPHPQPRFQVQCSVFKCPVSSQRAPRGHRAAAG